jgi:hypothetical protein
MMSINIFVRTKKDEKSNRTGRLEVFLKIISGGDG